MDGWMGGKEKKRIEKDVDDTFHAGDGVCSSQGESRVLRILFGK